MKGKIERHEIMTDGANLAIECDSCCFRNFWKATGKCRAQCNFLLSIL